MSRSNQLVAPLLLAASLAASVVVSGCVAADDTEVPTGEVSQEMSTYRITWFFADEAMTEMVGERSSLCTSGLNWGVRTPWVYSESGDCMPPSPMNYPGGTGTAGGCTCCWDGNSNGSCDYSEEGTWHTCSSSMNCY